MLERKHDEKDEEKVRKIEQELAWEDDMLEVLVDSYRELEKTYVLWGILTDWFFWSTLYLKIFDKNDDGFIDFHEFNNKKSK